MRGSWRDMGVPGLWYAMGKIFRYDNIFLQFLGSLFKQATSLWTAPTPNIWPFVSNTLLGILRLLM